MEPITLLITGPIESIESFQASYEDIMRTGIFSRVVVVTNSIVSKSMKNLDVFELKAVDKNSTNPYGLNIRNQVRKICYRLNRIKGIVLRIRSDLRFRNLSFLSSLPEEILSGEKVIVD